MDPMMKQKLSAFAEVFFVLSLIAGAAAYGLGPQTTPRPHFIVHGHRGARAKLPENTLPSFVYAVEQGVDFLEMDMAVTSDGEIVISHDPRINPVICQGPDGKRIVGEGPVIHSLTLAQVKTFDCGTIQNPKFTEQAPQPGTRIPRLDEVFTMVEKLKHSNAKKVQFNIETKIFADHPELTVTPEEFVKTFLAVVDRHHLRARVVLQSFDYRTLETSKWLAPEVRISALSENRKEDLAESVKKLKAEISSPDWEMLTAEAVEKLHAAGAQVHPWTANTPEAWTKLLEMKVDGIISDDPAALIAWLKAKKLR